MSDVKRYTLVSGAISETFDQHGNPSGDYVRASDYDAIGPYAELLTGELTVIRQKIMSGVRLGQDTLDRIDAALAAPSVAQKPSHGPLLIQGGWRQVRVCKTCGGRWTEGHRCAAQNINVSSGPDGLAAHDATFPREGHAIWGDGGWRDITNATPPEHEDVLIAQMPSPMVWAGYRIEDEWYVPGDDVSFNVRPTHWMPIPAVPWAMCRRCNGAGSIEVPDTTRGPDGDYFTVNCPECSGTGAPPKSSHATGENNG